MLHMAIVNQNPVMARWLLERVPELLDSEATASDPLFVSVPNTEGDRKIAKRLGGDGGSPLMCIFCIYSTY